MFLLSGFPHVLQQRTLFFSSLFSVRSHFAVMDTSKAEGLNGIRNEIEKWAERLFAGECFGHRLKIVVFMYLGTTVNQNSVWA